MTKSFYLHIDASRQPELHVIHEGDIIAGWSVWLNTGIADHDGLCLSAGADTREAAMGEASAVLQRLADQLDRCIVQGPAVVDA